MDILCKVTFGAGSPELHIAPTTMKIRVFDITTPSNYINALTGPELQIPCFLSGPSPDLYPSEMQVQFYYKSVTGAWVSFQNTETTSPWTAKGRVVEVTATMRELYPKDVEYKCTGLNGNTEQLITVQYTGRHNNSCFGYRQ